MFEFTTYTHKKNLLVHNMTSTTIVRYNITITIIEVASWSKFIDGYVQILILKFMKIDMWETW
jgi:hypothetical protein